MPPIRKGDGTAVAPKGISQVRTGDGRIFFDGPAIPDPDIYLQDDWGDNNITDRDGGGTTTYNGVEGVYRPEFTIIDGSPSAADEQLEMTGEAAISADINLNTDETITWEWTDVDASATGGDWVALVPWADGNTVGSGRTGFVDSLWIPVREDTSWDLNSNVDGNTGTEIGGGSLSGSNDISLTRESDGTFELFHNGVSQGTTTFDEGWSPDFVGYVGQGGSDITVDEIKVF